MIHWIARWANVIVNRSQITAITLARSNSRAHIICLSMRDHSGTSRATTSNAKRATTSGAKPRFLHSLRSPQLLP